MRLTFPSESRSWRDGLLLGNGRLGLSWSGEPADWTYHLTEETFWSSGRAERHYDDAPARMASIRRLLAERQAPKAQAVARDLFRPDQMAQAAFQPLGRLQVRLADGQGTERRSLSTESGVGSGSTRLSDGLIVRSTMIPLVEPSVFLVHLEADRAVPIGIDFYSDFPSAADWDGAMLHARGTWHELSTPEQAALSYRYFGDPMERCLSFAVGVGVLGDVDVLGPGRFLARDLWLTIDAATDFEAGDRLESAIRRRNDVDSLLAAATTGLRRPQAHLTLGSGNGSTADTARLVRGARAGLPADALLNAAFDYGVHLLSASTTGGTLPPTLQGVWCGDLNSAWGSKWTVNINLQMNLWAAGPVEVPDAVEVFVSFLESLVESGRGVSAALYAAEGWVLHHNTDLWRTTSPADLVEVGMWPTGGVWLCLQAWDLISFEPAGDKRDDLRRRLLEVMRGAAHFVTSFLREDADGRLVTSPSSSPEVAHLDESTRATRPDRIQSMHRYSWLCESPALDVWLVGDLLRTMANEPAAGSEAEREAWALTAARLRPVVVDDGLLSDWTHVPAEDIEQVGHRHLSPLYPVFPGRSDMAVEPLRDAAAATLEARFEGVRSFADQFGGWSLMWAACLWARLGDGERAVSALDRWATTFVSPVLLNTWPGYDGAPAHDDIFQIDANLGLVAAIAEMLVQSHTNTVRILPAIPARWRDGRATGLRVRGGARLDVHWSDGFVRSVVLHDVDERLTVAVPARLLNACSTLGPDIIRHVEPGCGPISLDLEAEVSLSQGDPS